MMIHKKDYNKNTKIDELLDDGYTGLEALQILDMLKNNETIDDLVDLSSLIYLEND